LIIAFKTQPASSSHPQPRQYQGQRLSRGKGISRSARWRRNIVPYLYRPFDKRWLLYKLNLIETERGGAGKFFMQHIQHDNLAVVAMRLTPPEGFNHINLLEFITVMVTNLKLIL
jgi:hypothetical protein